MRGDRVALYARVSTEDQDFKAQVARIEEWAESAGLEVVHRFTDVASGKDASRDGFRSLMRLARGHRFDVVAVAKLDRWARSLMDLERTVTELTDLGITFFIVDDQLRFDPDDPMGKAFVRFLGVLAELESDLISQRTKESLAAKKRGGERLGRPRKPCEVCGADRSDDPGKRVRVAGERVQACSECASISPAMRRRIYSEQEEDGS